MNTTEIFVEQVIVGIAVLVTGCLLVAPEQVSDLASVDLGELALVVVAAYLIGIVVDRVFDTLLQDLEQHHRLLFALKEKNAKKSGKKEDPFPEDKYRMALIGSGDAFGQGQYYRSRMRLMRSMAGLSPALGVGIALQLAGAAPGIRLLSMAVVVGCYLVGFVGKVIPRSKAPGETARQGVGGRRAQPRKAHWGLYSLPRTDDSDGLEWYEKHVAEYDASEKRPKRGIAYVVLRRDLVPYLGLVLGVWAGVLSATVGMPLAGVGVAAGTILLTGLFGWCWWRIMETYLDYVRDVYRELKSKG